MHELGITERILAIVLQKAGTVETSGVTRINLVFGELSGIVDESVEFYFRFLSKDTIAARASLSFQHPPTRLRCRHCDTVFSPEGMVWDCPNCPEHGVEVVSGRECYVASIEVD